MKHRNIYTALGGTLMVGTLTVAGMQVSSATDSAPTAASKRTVSLDAHLDPLNDSGAKGHAHVEFKGNKAHVHIKAKRLAKGLPHAQHIHFGKQAENECPGLGKDENGDFRITTVEGVPSYGPVRASLTTKGDTSAASVLAVTRYPTAEKGKYDYERTIKVGKNVARGIRNGNAVIVVHGVDYNANGEYDFKSAGKSDLDPTLPAEATDPALCGVLHVK